MTWKGIVLKSSGKPIIEKIKHYNNIVYHATSYDLDLTRETQYYNRNIYRLEVTVIE